MNFENPVLFLEISRIKCGVAKCVLPQQVFTVPQEFATEDEILKHLKDTREYQMVVDNGLEVYPFFTFVNRILSKPTITPDVQFFVHKGCRKEFDVMRKIEREVLNGSIGLEDAREKLIRIEGRMFGYPDCCIENYIKGKTSLPAESKLILEGIESGVFDDVLGAFLNSEVLSLPQFFTSGFYPCSIGCKRAVSVGKKIERWLGEARDVFRVRCMVNALHLIVAGYKASKGRGKFSEKVGRFYSGIESKKLELIEIVQPHISNLTAFTNHFIRRIADSFFETEENQKN